MATSATHKLHGSSTLEELFDHGEAPSTSPTLVARHIRARFEAMRAVPPVSASPELLELLTHHRDRAIEALEAGALGQGIALTSPSSVQVGDALTIGAAKVSLAGLEAAQDGLRRGHGVLDASGDEVHVVMADTSQGDALIERARGALARLFSDDAPQHKHLPRQFAAGRIASSGRLALVIGEREHPTLATLLQAHPGLCDPEHMVWILRRALSVLGWAHKNGVVHGDVSPDTLRIRATDHNVWLHDWEYASTDPAISGQGFIHTRPDFSPPEVGQRRSPLPSSDLYALGRTMQWLLRGGRVDGELPQDTPEELVRLLRFMTLESPVGRARDAWELYDEVERIRRHIYGQRRFKKIM